MVFSRNGYDYITYMFLIKDRIFWSDESVLFLNIVKLQFLHLQLIISSSWLKKKNASRRYGMALRLYKYHYVESLFFFYGTVI